MASAVLRLQYLELFLVGLTCSKERARVTQKCNKHATDFACPLLSVEEILIDFPFRKGLHIFSCVLPRPQKLVAAKPAALNEAVAPVRPVVAEVSLRIPRGALPINQPRVTGRRLPSPS